MRVLVVNAGSSTLKLALLDGDRTLGSREVEVAGFDAPAERAIHDALDELGQPDAVGHRVVHGGGVYRSATRIDPDVRARLADFVDLAPLHQPAALAGIDLVAGLLPGVPAVACFDTAFHSTLPPAAATYAIPAQWREEHGLHRYAFHGLSHAYAARRAAEMMGRDDLRVVVCHLGAGASLAAVRDGRSVDTTMGFTPLEGLVMATRSGSVDPGLLVWLLRHGGLAVDDLDEALVHRSGLTALAGTPDMRTVVERAGAGDQRAELALAVYVHRLRAGIAAMAASLDGLDVLVFTAGVGERAPVVRERAAAGLGFLGVRLDPKHNAVAEPDADISAEDTAGPAARTLVIAAREDLQIAAEVRELLGS